MARPLWRNKFYIKLFIILLGHYFLFVTFGLYDFKFAKELQYFTAPECSGAGTCTRRNFGARMS